MLRNKILLVLLAVWLVYSLARVVKHGWVILNTSWEPQSKPPAYLQHSLQYKNYLLWDQL